MATRKTEYAYWIRGWDGKDHSAWRDSNTFECESKEDAEAKVAFVRSGGRDIDVVVVERRVRISDWEVVDGY